MSVVLGVDIGGSHITAALVDLVSRTVIPGSRKRKLVDSKASAEQILNNWSEVINESFDEMPTATRKVGIAMPGPFNYIEGISLIEEQDKFRSLLGMNIKLLLAEQLNVVPESIRFMNDAACFLQGEVFCGAARGYDRVLGLTLGTGLGSAISYNGMADDADLWNAPFKEGIAEDYLSTRWFVKQYFDMSRKEISGVRELTESADPTHIKLLFDTFGTHLGQFLVQYIEKYDAEAVVLGGNISHALHHFRSSLLEVLSINNLNIELDKSLLNEDAALIGAASCWTLAENTSGMKAIVTA